MTDSKNHTQTYMDKKLKLLYVQVGLNALQLLCIIAFLVWLFMYPDVLKAIFD